MSAITCGQPVTTGMPGGIRYSGRCGKPVEKDGMCRDHVAEAAYQRRQFADMMAKASRHWQAVGVHGKGVECGGCGAFVKPGEEHPWDVPERQEANWWRDHPSAPHRPDDAEPMHGARIRGDGYDVQLCTSEPLTESERAALYEFFRTSLSGSSVGRDQIGDAGADGDTHGGVGQE